MTDQERIEEAHGLWELAVARVAAIAEAMVEVDAQATRSDFMKRAVADERKAFEFWQAISRSVLEK